MARPTTRVGPEILHGIEINPFAAELARTTIWIGDIQWSIKNAIYSRPQPILRKLDSIERRDAILNEDGSEAEWPEADFIVGNPPFLGGKKLLRKDLGDAYVRDALSRPMTDARARRSRSRLLLVRQGLGGCRRGPGEAASGLVSTNSIRGGANRRVLEPIAERRRDFRGF